MRLSKKWMAAGICAAALMLHSSAAFADVFHLTLSDANSGLDAYPSPYAEVSINLIDSTHATFTVTGDTTGAYTYLLGGEGIFGFNSTDTITFSGLSSSDLTFAGSGNEDGFGSFAYTFDNFDGLQHAVSSLSFTATNTSGTWASAADILDPNLPGGFLAAAHIFVTGDSCRGACVTGYATNGDGGGGSDTVVPEPATLALFGFGALFAGARARRRKAA